MEPFFILLVVGLALGAFLFAKTAFERLGHAEREAKSYGERVLLLERKILTLSKVCDDLQAAGFARTEHPEARPAPMSADAPIVAQTFGTPRAEGTPPPLPLFVPRPARPEPRPADLSVPNPDPGVQRPVAPAAPRPEIPRPAINWEQFLGAKLFAWIGGLALFLGLAFFLKYALDAGWIPYVVRVATGFVVGVGLLIGGERMKQKAVKVTAHTLCATGVLVLYACTFACRASYQDQLPLLGSFPALLLMTLITAVAFVLAVRLDAQVVAVLGILGGFFTPLLLSSGQDNPGGLFGYIALIDIGLLAVVLYRRWNYLIPLGALGTVIMEIGWTGKFFEANSYFLPGKMGIPLLILSGFFALFAGAMALAKRRGQLSDDYSFTVLGLALVAFGFTFYYLDFEPLAERPFLIFGFAFLIDLGVLLTVYLDPRRANALPVGGLIVFGLLGYWTKHWMSEELLNPGLALILIFTVLHSAVPLAFQRLRGITAPGWWSQVFPALALILTMGPMLSGTSLSFLIWPFVLLVDVIAVVLAVLSGALLSILLVLVLTLVVTGASLAHIPVSLIGLPLGLTMLGVFAVFFMLASFLAIRKLNGKALASAASDGSCAAGAGAGKAGGTAKTGGGARQFDVAAMLPAFSVALPFLLLIMVSARLPITNPSAIFGLALLLIVLLLGVARLLRVQVLPLVGLLATVALEYAWHGGHFAAATAAVPLMWYLTFYAVFTGFPFVFRKAYDTQALPWVAAALAGPLHFPLVHSLVQAAYPNSMMGLVPAAFVVPTLVGLIMLVKKVSGEELARNTQLAWFGGVALFFITLIFPVQFDRQWITLGWALEGAALCWLFGRIPHRGLPLVGVGLLLVAFLRLAVNPLVLSYHVRSEMPIFNWYLYSYGLVALSLFAAARLLAPPKNIVFGSNVQPILYGLGTVLTFLLLNIEIADFFTAAGSPVVTLQFSGNLARDMSYSIAWAGFALLLLVLGIRLRQAPIRYAGIGLLSVTLLKLFLHDLSTLGQLFRIGALVVVAVIALVSAYLYQRFLAVPEPPNENLPTPPLP